MNILIFESIAKKKEQIEELENNKTALKETLIRLESRREELKIEKVS